MKADEFQIKANSNVEASISLSKVIEGLADGNYDLQVDALLNGMVQVSSPVVNFDKVSASDPTIIGKYNFNESTGDLLDSNGDNDGTIYGGILREQQGVEGFSYKFNGSNSYIQMPFSIQSNHSISFWIYRDATFGSHLVFSQYDDSNSRSTYVQTLPDNTLRAALIDSVEGFTSASAGIIPLEEWMHIAITVEENDSIKIYKDAVLQESTSLGMVNWSTSNMLIGKYLEVYYGQFLDQVTFFNTVIDQAKITELKEEFKPAA